MYEDDTGALNHQQLRYALFVICLDAFIFSVFTEQQTFQYLYRKMSFTSA